MHCVKIRLDRKAGLAFVDGLPDDDPNLVVWMPEDGDSVMVEAFVGSAAEADSLRVAWRVAATALGCPNAGIEVSPVRDADWTTDWRSHFHIERLGQRLVICPDWEAYAAEPGEWVVRMDPGMSFGTGQHATTRACLQFLDACREERGRGLRFLDLGCGSGILAVTAALMDYVDVTAVDIDPRALPDTIANSRRNGVEHRVRCVISDLAAFDGDGPSDVVAANLLADLLIEQAPVIADRVVRSSIGDLFVAGVLHHQYPAVLDAYRRYGFDEKQVVKDGEWRSGWLRRLP